MLKPEQIRYLTEVLGIDSVLRPNGISSQAGAAREAAAEGARRPAGSPLRERPSVQRMRLLEGKAEAPFVFFVKTQTAAFSGGPEHEILTRIAGAMKLQAKQFCIVQAADGEDAQDFVNEHRNQVGIFFCGLNAGSIKSLGNCVVLYTHTLKQLIDDASLKKATWAGLQEIMKAAKD